MQETVAGRVLAFLRAERVDHLFGVPGSGIEELMDALWDAPDIRFVTAQHEQGAGFMAMGYQRASGRPGVCTVTKGPGGSNLLTSVTAAYYESLPVVAILGDATTKGFGRQRSAYQETDYVGLFRPVTKRALRLERAERIDEALAVAFRTAQSGRPGPVALAIPSDLWTAKVEVGGSPDPRTYRPTDRPRGNPDAVARAADLLAKAARPVLLLGGGARGTGAVAIRVAELVGGLIGSTSGVKAVVPEDHPRSLDCLGRHGNPLGRFLHQADVVLAVGTTLSEATTRFSPTFLDADASLIQVDIDPEEIGRVYPVAVGIVGDAGLVLQDIEQELRRTGRLPSGPQADPHVRALAEAKAEWERDLSERAASDAVPIGRLRFQRDARAALPRDAMVLAEGGGTINYFLYSFPSYGNGHTPGDLSPLGIGYPYTLGLKCGAPERVVASFHGDGAFMFSCNELATAVHWRIPTVAMVLHNDVYGNERLDQHVHHPGRFVGTDLCIPDLAAMAQAFGAHGERVERPAQIGPAIERALGSGRPAVLDVVISSEPEELMPPRRR